MGRLVRGNQPRVRSKGINSSLLQAPIEARLRMGLAGDLRRAEVAPATQAGLSNGVDDDRG